MNRIIVDRGVVKRLSYEIGCSERTVRDALRFCTDGQQPNLIRLKAVRDYGGVVIRKKLRPLHT